MAEPRALVRALFQSVDTLSRAMETRDLYTAGHQSAVARLARRIAQRLGLPPETVQGARLGAQLHDIGKIGIPNEILTKPARLTPEEAGLIRTHPALGHGILAGVAFPWPVAEIVLQHHERMDGSGYPRGLRSDDILVEARIVAVADLVDSMIGSRPYRAALGARSARDELLRHRGGFYDEAVVDACLAVMSEDEAPAAVEVPKSPA